VENFSPRLENFFAKACHRGRTVRQGWEIFSPRLAGQALVARGKIFTKAGSCLGSPWKNFRQGWKIFSPRHVIAGEPATKAGKFFAKACHRGRTVCQGWEIFSPRLAGQALVARGKIFAKAGSCLGSPWKNPLSRLEIFFAKACHRGRTVRQGWENFSPRLAGQALVARGKIFAKAGSCLGSPWKNFRQGWKKFSPRHVIAGEPSAKAGKIFRPGWPVRPW